MYSWIKGLIEISNSSQDDMFLQESWAKYGPDVLRRRRFFTWISRAFKGEIVHGFLPTFFLRNRPLNSSVNLPIP